MSEDKLKWKKGWWLSMIDKEVIWVSLESIDAVNIEPEELFFDEFINEGILVVFVFTFLAFGEVLFDFFNEHVVYNIGIVFGF